MLSKDTLISHCKDLIVLLLLLMCDSEAAKLLVFELFICLYCNDSKAVLLLFYYCFYSRLVF